MRWEGGERGTRDRRAVNERRKQGGRGDKCKHALWKVIHIACYAKH